jgi:hypothetical protein
VVSGLAADTRGSSVPIDSHTFVRGQSSARSLNADWLVCAIG